MSSSPSHNEESKGYSPHMRGVAWGILVMGISLAMIIILWATIGYIGPDFSNTVMENQQAWLHEQYGLPPPEQLSPEMLQIPPSLRNIEQQGGGGAAQIGETGSGNQTAGGGNQTAETTGAATREEGASGGAAAPGGGAVTLTILEGSAIQGNPDYDPDELTVAAGSDVNVVNEDTVPHTVTSGTGPTDPNSAQLFDTSIINGGESTTLSLAQVSAGQYDYYCMVHPYMVGSIVVQ
ncbi:MAG TPA: cupredoxin domain-containing protein [Nitrososphaera sp.]|jgi:plastocyanin|nr:cupredoxin domain-containing protein [Nitrososphaera sp.]